MRFRKLDPRFWHDEKVRRLSPPEKLILGLQVDDCCWGTPAGPTCKHWRAFDEMMVVAAARDSLAEKAHEILVIEPNLTAEMLAVALVLAVGEARPRSRLIPWALPGEAVGQIAARVALDMVEPT
jgi:hypothetical protein